MAENTSGVNKPDDTKPTTWRLSFVTLFKRIWMFVKSPSLVIYLSIVILFVGGLGVWYPYTKEPMDLYCFIHKPDTLTNLATYSISILSAAMADFLLGSRQRGISIRMFVFSLFLMSLIFSFVGLSNQIATFSYLGLGIMILFWIVVYADDVSKGSFANLNDESERVYPVGPSDPQDVALSGTLEGLKA